MIISDLLFVKNKYCIKVYTKKCKKLGALIPFKDTFDWKQQEGIKISLNVMSKIFRYGKNIKWEN